MKKHLSEILEMHRMKYNDLKIENNFNIVTREAKLVAIEGYYKFAHLNDAELREVLIQHAVDIKHKFEVETSEENKYVLGCALEYWFELTDELKSVKIVAEANQKGEK